MLFAVGHCAIGYLIGEATSKLQQNRGISLPLCLALSVLPDIDFLLPLRHRGPTHSLVVLLGVAIPLLLVFRLRSLPYILAGLQHDLSDILTGGVQLFWPLSHDWYAVYDVTVFHVNSIRMELVLFALSIALFGALRGYRTFFTPHFDKMLNVVPIGFLAAPLLIRMYYPFPSILVLPSLVYLLLLIATSLISLIICVKRVALPNTPP